MFAASCSVDLFWNAACLINRFVLVIYHCTLNRMEWNNAVVSQNIDNWLESFYQGFVITYEMISSIVM